jgi:hypothetical protein
MPSPAILGRSSAATAGNTGATTGPAQPTTSAPGRRPFVAASYPHRENTGYDKTFNLGAGAVTPDLMPIPASGYLRNLVLRVDIVTVGGTPTLAADGPWNVFQDFTLGEPNGNPIVSVPSGYLAYLINKYGGYRGYNDPKTIPGYTTPAAGTPGTTSFTLIVPLEVAARDALGAIANQASNSQFQFRMLLAPLGTVFSSAPTSATIRIRSWIETWLQPLGSSQGAANNTEPPAKDTTQYWTVVNKVLTAGANNIDHTRLGNLGRMFIYIFKDATGARQESQVFPQPVFEVDGAPLDSFDDYLWQNQIYERYGYTNTAPFGSLNGSNGLDSGVRPYDFAHDYDGSVGFETRLQWLYTQPSSRVRLNGICAAAGQLQILTNDIVTPANAGLAA